MKFVGCEKKLGIRASDTATLVFEGCRIPRANLLGSAEVKKRDAGATGDKGFKGAMATFDASRPIVAAMAVGVGRVARAIATYLALDARRADVLASTECGFRGDATAVFDAGMRDRTLRSPPRTLFAGLAPETFAKLVRP